MRRAWIWVFLLAAAPWARAQYLVRTVAGSGFDGDGGPALSALLVQPEGLARDAQGNLYVSDAGDHRIREISSAGTIRTVAGTGVPGYSGDGGPASAARLSQPYGIALDAAGNLYIADLGNQRIRIVNEAGNISTFAGGGAQAVAANLPATNALLNSPRNVAAALDGTVYFSDFGGQAVFAVKNGVIALFAGNGVAGDSGDGGPAALAELNFPAGVAVDPAGSVYIADSGNNALREVVHGVISTVASVQGPTGLALDQFGNPYVAAQGLLGSPFQPGASTLSATDLVIDPSNDILFSTGYSVEKLTPLGSLELVAGAADGVFFGDGGAAVEARLNQPWAVAYAPDGSLFIADTGNNRIRKVSPKGVISTIAGTGDASALSSPSSIALDAAGDLYIADTGNNRVMLLSADGAYSTTLTQLKSPSALAVDAQGNVYVADRGHGRIVVLSSAGLLAPFASVKDPIALAVDRAGDLFVSDNSQNALLEISPGASPAVIWQGDAAPAGVAVDGAGNVFLGDIAGNRVQEISPQGVVTTIAGGGPAGLAGDGGAALAASFFAPAGLCLDPAGDVFVADSANNRVRELTAQQAAILPPPGESASAAFTIANAASNVTQSITPGEIVSIYGNGFDPSTAQVSFNGAAAKLFFAGPSQINALVPASLAVGPAASVTVSSKGAALGTVSASTAAAAPGLFTLNGGQGQAAALNQDGSPNSASNPAAAGSVVTLFATGQGDGSTANLAIDGAPSPMLYAGPAPGFAGLTQIDARVPTGLSPGPATVVLTISGVSSQPGVTIAVE